MSIRLAVMARLLVYAVIVVVFERVTVQPAGVKRRRGDRETPNKGDLLQAVSVSIGFVYEG